MLRPAGARLSTSAEHNYRFEEPRKFGSNLALAFDRQTVWTVRIQKQLDLFELNRVICPSRTRRVPVGPFVKPIFGLQKVYVLFFKTSESKKSDLAL